MGTINNANLLQQVLDSVSDGVYRVNRNRKILYWSRGAERLTGYPGAEVIGSHCYDNILHHVDGHGRNLCKGMCPLMKAIRYNKTIQTRVFLRHKDGHRVPVAVKTFPVRDSRGRVTGAMEVFSDLSPRRILEERIHKLERLAWVDSLTGLANRRFLSMTLRAKIEQARRYDWKIGIVFVDIDNFKAVNDTWGHNAGDKVLRMVAGNLLGNSRSFDTIGRWGGEEFIAICENANLTEVRVLAERYRMLVQSSSVPVASGRIHLTISAGATLVKPGDTVKSLVERADRLLYESKQAGRNRVTAG